MRRFTSQHTNKLDRKGRVSVPASFRSMLEATGSATTVFLKRNKPDGAIDGLTESFLAEVEARIDPMPIGSKEREWLEHTYFADVVPVRLDPEGRIVLPDDLREFADLSDQVLFVGLGQRFQIWDPDAYKAHRDKRDGEAPEVVLPRAQPSGGAAP